MAIKLDCPRCKKPLSIPRKKIGRYVNCPRCSGRFWVPEKAAEASESGAAVPPAGTIGPLPVPPDLQVQPQPPEPLPATISLGSARTVSPEDAPQQAAGGHGASALRDSGVIRPGESGPSPWQVVPPPVSPGGATPAAGWGRTSFDPSHPPFDPSHQPASPPGPSHSPPPPPGPKTARFVSAEAAQSTLKLAEDGKLPELHLRAGQEKDKREAKTTSVNPLVLFGLLAVSVVLCIALAMLDVGPPKTPHKDRARREIEERFFPRDGQKPAEYQEYLMKAQRANTQGDFRAERKAYEKVLDLLRQERSPYAQNDRQWSVTTSPRGDEELKRLISILLSNE
jgi:DNA-directed RNA polymerase subunit RPC12/RpoP